MTADNASATERRSWQSKSSPKVVIVLHGTQQDFPVLENGQLLGILMRADLIGGLARGGAQMPVGQIVRRDYSTVSGREMLQTAIDKLNQSSSRTLPVMDGGKLQGLFTIENLGEFLLVRSALGNKKGKSRRTDSRDTG